MRLREWIWPALPRLLERREIEMPQKMPGADARAHLLALTQARYDQAGEIQDRAVAVFAQAEVLRRRAYRLIALAWVANAVAWAGAVLS